jgi:hypothetical protein
MDFRKNFPTIFLRTDSDTKKYCLVFQSANEKSSSKNAETF